MAGGPRSVGPEPPSEVTKIPKTGQQLLAALQSGPLARAELFKALVLTDQSANAARHLKPLLDAGLVEMAEPAKPVPSTKSRPNVGIDAAPDVWARF